MLAVMVVVPALSAETRPLASTVAINGLDEAQVTVPVAVLGVTALGDTLADAIHKAYAAAEQIHFDGAHMRRDIGKLDM